MTNPLVWEFMIQTLPDYLTEMRPCSIMLAVHVMFVEKYSLRVLAVYLAKSWRKYHLSDVAG
jgi:hypothetical protein